jgi:hypothetical protein
MKKKFMSVFLILMNIISMIFLSSCTISDAEKTKYIGQSTPTEKNYYVNNSTEEAEAWSSSDAFDAQIDVCASFDISNAKHRDENGNPLFVVANLTDIHYSHDRSRLSRTNALKYITKYIEQTNPDLITITGDLISYFEDKDEYLTTLCYFFDSFNIPWAPILGNHDGFEADERAAISDVFVSGEYNNVIFRRNDPELGVGNYIITITNGSEIVHSIMMLDSHSERIYPDGTKGYDYIWEPQFDWYEWAVDGLTRANDNKPVPISCFLHIPPVEYIAAFKGYQEGIYSGVNDNNEEICVPGHLNPGGPYNNGFFDHAKSLGTKLFLCGHDHTNTSYIDYQDVTLAYSLCAKGNRFCNGKRTVGTTVTYDLNGDFILNSYIYRFGKIKLIDNLA